MGVEVMEKLPAVSESQHQHTQHVVTAISSLVTEKGHTASKGENACIMTAKTISSRHADNPQKLALTVADLGICAIFRAIMTTTPITSSIMNPMMALRQETAISLFSSTSWHLNSAEPRQ